MPDPDGGTPTCRVADVPVKPHATIADAWDVWCGCGWGATCDSPEAAVIGLAWHLKGGDTVG